MNEEYNLLTSLRFLLKHLDKEERQENIKKVLGQLQALKENQLIDFEDKTYDVNAIIEITVAPVEIPYTWIKSTNKGILTIKSKVNNNTLFCVFSYLASLLPRDERMTVPVSMEKISKTIGVSIPTVQDALKELSMKGIIIISDNGYNKITQKHNCNQYWVTTFDKRSESGLSRTLIDIFNKRADMKRIKNQMIYSKDYDDLIQDSNNNEIIEDILINKEIYHNIQTILHNPNRCTSLLIGKYATALKRKYLAENKTGIFAQTHEKVE